MEEEEEEREDSSAHEEEEEEGEVAGRWEGVSEDPSEQASADFDRAHSGLDGEEDKNLV